jgi:hypothetical protein
MKNEFANIFRNLIMLFVWLAILAITTVIVIMVAGAWFDPVALLVLVPVTMMLLCTVWFGDGEY